MITREGNHLMHSTVKIQRAKPRRIQFSEASLAEVRALRDRHPGNAYLQRRAAALLMLGTGSVTVAQVTAVTGLKRLVVLAAARSLRESGATKALFRGKSPGRPSQRAIVAQWAQSGISPAEIAGRAGLHVDTVRLHLRALRKGGGPLLEQRAAEETNSGDPSTGGGIRADREAPPLDVNANRTRRFSV